MHYRGLLRIARREGGIRLYAAREANVAAADPAATMDTLVDIVVNKYAPLPATTLSQLVMMLKFAVPHWRRRAEVRAGAREVATAACDDRRPDLVLAGRREPAFAPPRRERRGALVSSVRPRGLGPTALRILLGLGLPIRGLHAGRETRARLLRAAAMWRDASSAGAICLSLTDGSYRRWDSRMAAHRRTRRSGGSSTPNLRASRLSSAWRQAYVSAAAIGVLRRTERRIAHAGLTVLQVARRMAQKVLVLVDAHRHVIPTEARLQADSPLERTVGF